MKNTNSMATSLKVAVIGAGLSGLITARELQKESHQVVVFEKSHRLGGIWVYDPRVESDLLGLDPNREIVHGTIYKSLQANSPRQLTEFFDYPFRVREDGDPRLFPGHEEVLKYLEDFAEHYDLIKLIRFNAEVTRVELLDSCKTEFVVEWKTSGVSSEEVFDAVVVCNGHHTQPRVATDIPGIDKWTKKQVHSHNYRVPEPYADEVVVVIGSAPSAIDISREISTVTKEVHLSSRSPNVKVSKLDKYNNMWQHSKIDSVYEDGTVAFQDGVTIKADTIFHCTGYEIHIPFLKISDIVTVDDGKRVGPLYKHVFPPQLAPRLSFVGLPKKVTVFHAAELQSRWIAQTLSGKISLPSVEEMLDDVEEHYRQMEEKGIPKHDTHSLENKTDYLDWIAAQLGITERVEHVKNLYNLLVQCYLNRLVPYRDAFEKALTLDHGI